MAEAYPDSVIPGEEVRTKEGIDVIGLYIEEEIPKGTPAREVCRRVKDQGRTRLLAAPLCAREGRVRPICGGARAAGGRHRGLQREATSRAPQ